MKSRDKISFGLLVCFLSFVLSLISLMINTQEVEQLKKQVADISERSNNNIEYLSGIVEEQNKTIEFYKNYVDNVARCIVDGEW